MGGHGCRVVSNIGGHSAMSGMARHVDFWLRTQPMHTPANIYRIGGKLHQETWWEACTTSGYW